MDTQSAKKTLLLVSVGNKARTIKSTLKKNAANLFLINESRSLSSALEFLEKNPCHIILLDMNLKDSPGLESLKVVYDKYPQLPVIVVLDDSEQIDYMELIVNGAQECLPMAEFKDENIVKYIHSAIKRKEMEINTINLKDEYEGIKVLLSELKKRNEELTKMDQLKTNFISIVSHELRTPLTYIKEGISQVLEGLHGEINEDQREFLSISLEGVDRLKEIVNNLLDISKIEAGRIQLRKSFMDINEVVTRVVNDFQTVYRKKGIVLDLDLPGTPLNTYIDREKIIQVITNLLSNAYKFTERGKVTVKVEDKPGYVLLSVRDTGVGITEENLNKVFDKFVQVGRTDGPGIKGTGLGLGIARGLVEQHRGKMWAESESGRGSVFFFSIPYLDSLQVVQEVIRDSIIDADLHKSEFVILLVKIENIDYLEPDVFQLGTDTVLNSIEDIVRNVLRRGTDQIYRLSRDESIIILPDTKWEGALSLRHRFTEKTRAYLGELENDYRIKVNIDLGMSGFPRDSDKSDILLEKARANRKDLYLGDERRHASRLPVDMIIIGANNDGEKKEFKTINISLGGVCFISRKYISLPEHNEIEICLPEEYGNIRVKTVISWTEKLEDLDEYQIGLKFMDLGDKERDKLFRFIELSNRKA